MKNAYLLTFLMLIAPTSLMLHSAENSKKSIPRENLIYINLCGLPYVICSESGYEYTIKNELINYVSAGLSVQVGSGLFSIRESDTGSPEINGLNIRGNYGIILGKLTLYSQENFNGWHVGVLAGTFWQKVTSENDICDACTLVSNEAYYQNARFTGGFGGGYAFSSETIRFLFGLRILYAEKFQIPYSVIKNNSQITASATSQNLGYPFAGTLVAAVGYVF